MKKVYIVSPVKTATGGSELLHQLSEKLLNLGIYAYMLYIGEYSGSSVENRFDHYRKNITEHVEDSNENLIIVPETLTGELYKYKRIRKAIWWLSVDFYPGSRRRHVDLLHTIVRYARDLQLRCYDKKWIHFIQSEYARQYLVNERQITSDHIYRLSDYISKTYFTNLDYDVCKKENTVLYNPKKGYEFTKKLIERYPEIEWKPLINLTPEEMKQALLKAKVYIDFGNHPGKDRIPREAALCGCCVITGLCGSAENKIDVQIPDINKFKNDDENIPKIYDRICMCFKNYSSIVSEYDEYREKIKGEEEQFTEDIKKFFFHDF